MSDMQYARVVQAFFIAYTLMYIFAGRITDWLETRVSLAGFVAWWSIANVLTAFSSSVFSLGIFRFLLGVGEPGIYTAGPKAVSEWTPPKERGLAIGIYTAGATLGATIAAPLIAFLAFHFGWRMTFVITGILGLIWVAPWLWLYRPPAKHPRIADAERKLIEENEPAENVSHPTETELQLWKQLLVRRETWLLLIARFLTDPVWYFYLFWFPKYLTDSRHLKLLELGKVAWVVYLAADIGAILGGIASGYLIKRGMRTIPARKRIMILAACLIPLSPLVAFVPSVPLALFIAGIIAFAHMSWLVTMGAMIVDLFPKRTVATVFGIIAAGTGLGGLASQEVVGRLVTHFSYTPVFIIMGLVHPLALLLIRAVREPKVSVGK
jgi:ACS family hexuronate transporter-like MFS transporter